MVTGVSLITRQGYGGPANTAEGGVKYEFIGNALPQEISLQMLLAGERQYSIEYQRGAYEGSRAPRKKLLPRRSIQLVS